MRLLHDGAQPGAALAEAFRFGMQDTRGDVHAGHPLASGVMRFDACLAVGTGREGAPVFKGAFAHGPPAGRFLYLSWKRIAAAEHPWGWRIKMPLAGIGWPEVKAVESQQLCLVANVTGRRPHASEPVAWDVEALA